MPVSHRTIQVYLQHSCPIMRAGLHAVLSGQDDFAVLNDPHRCAPQGGACVIVTDYEGGLRAAREAPPRHTGQLTRLLVLTTQDKEWEIRHAIEHGVHGYLLQGCDAAELVDGVRMLSRGNRYLCETAHRNVAGSFERDVLTPRETDVLRVLARGSSDKLIARELGITAGTVKSHMKQLLHKLGATARTHAVVVAMERGLLVDQ
jgi:DNA-binding NarL/FixJ family response regulator